MSRLVFSGFWGSGFLFGRGVKRVLYEYIWIMDYKWLDEYFFLVFIWSFEGREYGG